MPSKKASPDARANSTTVKVINNITSLKQREVATLLTSGLYLPAANNFSTKPASSKANVNRKVHDVLSFVWTVRPPTVKPQRLFLKPSQETSLDFLTYSPWDIRFPVYSKQAVKGGPSKMALNRSVLLDFTRRISPPRTQPTRQCLKPSMEKADTFQTFSPFDSRFPFFAPKITVKTSKATSPAKPATKQMTAQPKPVHAKQVPIVYGPAPKPTVYGPEPKPMGYSSSPKQMSAPSKPVAPAKSAIPTLSRQALYIIDFVRIIQPRVAQPSRHSLKPSMEKADAFQTFSPFDSRFPVVAARPIATKYAAAKVPLKAASPVASMKTVASSGPKPRPFANAPAMLRLVDFARTIQPRVAQPLRPSMKPSMEKTEAFQTYSPFDSRFPLVPSKPARSAAPKAQAAPANPVSKIRSPQAKAAIPAAPIKAAPAVLANKAAPSTKAVPAVIVTKATPARSQVLARVLAVRPPANSAKDRVQWKPSRESPVDFGTVSPFDDDFPSPPAKRHFAPKQPLALVPAGARSGPPCFSRKARRAHRAPAARPLPRHRRLLPRVYRPAGLQIATPPTIARARLAARTKAVVLKPRVPAMPLTTSGRAKVNRLAMRRMLASAAVKVHVPKRQHQLGGPVQTRFADHVAVSLAARLPLIPGDDFQSYSPFDSRFARCPAALRPAHHSRHSQAARKNRSASTRAARLRAKMALMRGEVAIAAPIKAMNSLVRMAARVTKPVPSVSKKVAAREPVSLVKAGSGAIAKKSPAPKEPVVQRGIYHEAKRVSPVTINGDSPRVNDLGYWSWSPSSRTAIVEPLPQPSDNRFIMKAALNPRVNSGSTISSLDSPTSSWQIRAESGKPKYTSPAAHPLFAASLPAKVLQDVRPSQSRTGLPAARILRL